jgi:hypothetical protein
VSVVGQEHRLLRSHQRKSQLSTQVARRERSKKSNLLIRFLVAWGQTRTYLSHSSILPRTMTLAESTPFSELGMQIVLGVAEFQDPKTSGVYLPS